MGGSFDAFKWAKDQRVGNSGAKLVLMMMADKANQRFEVYDAKTMLAQDCEMSKRTLDAQILYLVQHGFVTQIDRVRSKGTDATPLWVINHPEAPHLLGAPVTLDYKGNYLYPRYPDQLRAAAIEWISGGVQGAEHRKYPSSTQADEEENPGNPGVQDLHPTGVQNLHPEGAGSAPYGGAESAPLISTQQGSPPTNQGAADAADGWLDETKKTKTPAAAAASRSDVADTAGGVLLQSYGVAGRKLTEWIPIVDQALELLGQQRVEHTLIGGSSKHGPGAIVSTRLPALQAQLSRASSQQQQTSTRRPPWCEQCDYDNSRQVEDEHGRPKPCPRCHPRTITEA